MIVQHNIPAMNSHRNLGINNSQTAKNLEKLSSGYRINRAADDAAGLAISEKMRGQIRGLAQAEQNVKNGVSLIQTAEGGLNETHAILQRMRELAVASSNGTFQDEDRIQYTKEFEALKSEIDRIAESTHYNNIKLLDGSLGSGGSSNGASTPTVNMYNAAGTKTITGATGSGFEKVDATASDTTLGVTGQAVKLGDTYTFVYQYNGETKTFSHTFTADDFDVNSYGKDFRAALEAEFNIADFDLDSGGSTMDALFTNGGVFGTLAAGATSGTLELTDLTITAREKGQDVIVGIKEAITDKLTGAITYEDSNLVTNTSGSDAFIKVAQANIASMRYLEIDGQKFQFVNDDSELLDPSARAIYVAAKDTIAATDMASVIGQLKSYGIDARINAGAMEIYSSGSSSNKANSGKGLVFQIGANGGADQRVYLKVNSMDSKSIGVTSTNVEFSKLTGTSLFNAHINDTDSANKAIEIISGATNMVATQRAELGALQNRLESTLNSLGTAKENLTSAEAVIRDVDMAKEMMEFTKNNILVQAAQAMLAQANQLPQGILQLLR